MHEPTNEKITSQDVKSRLNDSFFLSKEEYTEINEAVIPTAEAGNKLQAQFPLKQARNIFATFHQYTKLDRFGVPTISRVPGDADAATVEGTNVRVDVPWHHIDFKLNQVDVENSRDIGEPLETVLASNAASRVANIIDEVIYSHTTSPFGTLGAAELFTGSHTGVDWSGTTPQVIYNDINTAIATIPEAYESDSMRLWLNKAQFEDLNRTNENGLTAKKLLADNFPGLQVVKSKQVTAGSGILYPFREDVAYWFNGMPRRTVAWTQVGWDAQFKVVQTGRLIVVTAAAGIIMNGL